VTINTKLSKFWSARRIAATIAGAPWAYLLWAGYDLCYGPQARVMAGYPNSGQVHLYIVAPFIGLIVSIAFFVLANKIPIWAAAIIFCLEVLSLLPLLGLWGAGI